MKTLAIFSLIAICVTVNAQQLIDVNDVYNQMFKLAKHCKIVVDRIDETLKHHALPQDEFVFDSSVPLLKELQLQIIRVSCQTIIFGSSASQKATLTEAINGGDTSDESSSGSSEDTNSQQP